MGLALGHKPTSSGNIHSPHPRPHVSGFAGFPLPASPFQGRGACVCRGGWGTWGLGLRKEEAGRGRRDTLFRRPREEGLCRLLPGGPPAGGGLEILPTPPTAASCPTWLPAQLRAQRSQMGLCVPRTKNTLLTPTWARACLPCSHLGHFPGGETEASRGTGPWSQGGSLPPGLGVKMERGGGRLATMELPS